MHKIILTALSAMLLSLFIYGCGGSSSSSSEPSAPSSTGIFVDAPVAGIAYSTSPSGYSGFTDAEGKFLFNEGDTVTFRIGNLVLGSAPAATYITPFDITDHNNAVLIARLIQTLSSVDNGTLIMNETAVDDINGLVTEETELDDFAGSFDTLNLIDEDVAIGNMNSDALYGVYAAEVNIVCDGEDNTTERFIAYFNGGSVNVYAISSKDSKQPPALSYVLSLFSAKDTPKWGLDFFSGNLTDPNSAVLRQYTEAGMPEYNMSMEYTDSSEFLMTFSPKDGSCTATATMKRAVGANPEDPSCSSVDLSVTDMPFISRIISSNDPTEIEEDNGTVTIVQDGCNVTLTEGDDTFKGFIDTREDSILFFGKYIDDNEENIEMIALNYEFEDQTLSFYGSVIGIERNLGSSEPAEWEAEEVRIGDVFN